MSQDLVVVLDCGATSVRAIAIGVDGQIVARASLPNHTEAGQEDSTWHIWPVDGILDKFCECSRKISGEFAKERVKALAVTTFGVDGALVDKDGNLLYPVISWKCPRNVGSHQNLKNYLSPSTAAQISGVGHFAFNTLNKLVWLKENQPALLQEAHAWLFISSIFNHRLTGVLATDATMAGTAQLTDLSKQQFSAEILSALDVNESLFPPKVQAGDVVGSLLPEAAERLGLPAGIPVVSAGHDTQFAMFGAGASQSQPVLSSGTWEILMARTAQIEVPSEEIFEQGFTCEWDAQIGKYNPGLQWLASGVLEWIGNTFFSQLEGSAKYDCMIKEALEAPEDCNGVVFDASFLAGVGSKTGGKIEGLTLNATRGSIYRAALKALADELKNNLTVLEGIGNFKTEELLLVGGGTKNALWNQIKADTLQMPVKVIKEAETTVLGAAMFAMAGAGLYGSPEDARDAFNLQLETIYPTE